MGQVLKYFGRNIFTGLAEGSVRESNSNKATLINSNVHL